MSTNLVGLAGNRSDENTAQNPSSSIWRTNFAYEDIVMGNVPGVAHHFDFSNFRTSSDVAASEAFWAGMGLKVFGSTGAPVATLDEIGGGTTISSDGDNEGASIGMMGRPFQISRSYKKLCFEARVKTSTIADTKHGFFLGLIDSSALSSTVPIAAAGTLADENFVGFHRLEGDGDYVDTVYKADTVTQVTVGSDAAVLVADTWIKLGFVYEPSDSNGVFYMTFYKNGVPLADKKQIPSAAGTDFPNDVRLGFVFAVLNATASTPGTSTIQWARIAQYL